MTTIQNHRYDYYDTQVEEQKQKQNMNSRPNAVRYELTLSASDNDDTPESQIPFANTCLATEIRTNTRKLNLKSS